MRLNSVARRYAQAVFNSAKSHNITNEVMADLALFEKTFKENENLMKILNSPIVSKDKKKSVAEGLFSSKIQPLSLDFVKLVIDKNRENVLILVKEEFEKLYFEANSISSLVIESVIELTEEQKNQIKDKLERKLNKKLKVENVINPNLIGGVRLLFDDNVIDGSVKTKLTQIEENLSK